MIGTLSFYEYRFSGVGTQEVGGGDTRILPTEIKFV